MSGCVACWVTIDPIYKTDVGSTFPSVTDQSTMLAGVSMDLNRPKKSLENGLNQIGNTTGNLRE